jgi:hypothetical protein
MGTEYWIIGGLVFLIATLILYLCYLREELHTSNGAWEKKCDAYREMKSQRDLYRNESRLRKEMMDQYDKEIARLKQQIVELENPPDTAEQLAEKNVKRPRCLIRPNTQLVQE